jgi:hypothetical protein
MSELRVAVALAPWLLSRARLLCNAKYYVAKANRASEVGMNQWLKRIRGALGMGLTWALGWAVAGLLIGGASVLLPGLPWDSFFRVFDAPLPALAVPGFFGGAVFSIVLGVAGRRRRFAELSVGRVALWGAIGGFVLSLIPAGMVLVGLATLRPDLSLWKSTAVICGPLTLMSGLSATASLLLARKAQGRELAATHEHVRHERVATGQ